MRVMCHLCNRGVSGRGLRGHSPGTQPIRTADLKRNIEIKLSFVLAPVSCRPSATLCSAGIIQAAICRETCEVLQAANCIYRVGQKSEPEMLYT